MALNFQKGSSATTPPTHPFEPEVCAVVVLRPEELKKNRPNVPFHSRLQNALGREMAAPFNFSV